MVLSRKPKNPIQSTYPRQSDYDSMRKDVRQGISAIIEAWRDGEISEEVAYELIRTLYSAYIGAVFSQQVTNYMDRAITHSLSLGPREEGSNGIGR